LIIYLINCSTYQVISEQQWQIDKKIIPTKIGNFSLKIFLSSQFIINLGLNTKKIKFILDNSEDKQNHKLYGTNLLTKDPTTIKEYKNPLIIVGHMSLYSDEIKQQLEKINSKSIFL